MAKKSTLSELIARTRDAETNELQREFFPGVETADLPERLEQINESVDVVRALMTAHMSGASTGYGLKGQDGKEYFHGERDGEAPLLSMKEALMSNDASIIFKRVVSDVLLKPIESPYIGQDILSRKIVVDGVRSVTFPTMGALRAGVISETGEYPQQSPSFTMQELELRVKKYGLQLAIADDVIEDSMWDVFGLYVSMARDAMKRLKEQNIFDEAFAKAHAVFNNKGTDPNGFTTGRAAGTTTALGALNGSVTMLDILETAGALIAEGYTPTDLVVHQLAYISLMQDPRLLFHGLMQGNYNQSMPTPGIDSASIGKFLPWGMLNVVVSPQVPFTFHTSITQGGSALPNANVTDMLMLDRQRSIVVLQRDEMHMEEFDDPTRDIHLMRVGERYAVGALDGGRSLASIKNVVLVQNHTPVTTFGFSAPV